MAMTIEAVYENGVLKPIEPLALVEHERVQITITTPTGKWGQKMAGICGWKGSSEELEEFALSPEYDPQESA